MANTQVNRGETKLGIFSDEEIREGLASGRFLTTDLFWHEGMPTWLPLAQFPAAGSAAAPSPGAPVPDVAIVAQGGGLPWDRRQELGFFPAFFETLKLVLLNPAVAFAQMKPEGGLVEPLIYALVGGSVGFIASILWNLVLGSMGAMNERNPLAGMIGAGVGMVFFIIFAPIFIAVCLFIGAAILHLCLMLVGGANRSFETTFRVVCFAVGSTNPLAIVPFCGGPIAGIWNIVVECIGLARAHQTTTGRAVLAVFLPLIVCCGGLFLLGLIFGFGLFSAMMGHHH